MKTIPVQSSMLATALTGVMSQTMQATRHEPWLRNGAHGVSEKAPGLAAVPAAPQSALRGP